MKKLLIIPVIIGILFFSCNKKFTPSASTGYNPVEKTLAANMVTNFYTGKLVSHKLDSTLGRINFNPQEISWLIKDANTLEVNLVLAAYLSTDPIVIKRNNYTVLIQLKKTNPNNESLPIYEYYDLSQPLNTARVKPICPPPPCGPTEQ